MSLVSSAYRLDSRRKASVSRLVYPPEMLTNYLLLDLLLMARASMVLMSTRWTITYTEYMRWSVYHTMGVILCYRRRAHQPKMEFCIRQIGFQLNFRLHIITSSTLLRSGLAPSRLVIEKRDERNRIAETNSNDFRRKQIIGENGLNSLVDWIKSPQNRINTMVSSRKLDSVSP